MNVSYIFSLEHGHIYDIAHDSASFPLRGVEDVTFPSDGVVLKGGLLS